MNLSLYSVTDKYMQACDVLAEQCADIPETAIADTLDALEGEVKDKALNVAGYYKNIQKEIAAMKEYVVDMTEKRRKLKRYSDRLENYLKDNMERCGISKIKGPEFSLSIRKKAPSIVIEDLEEIPQAFICCKTELIPDKLSIRAAIKDGDKVPGAYMQNGTTLIIK